MSAITLTCPSCCAPFDTTELVEVPSIVRRMTDLRDIYVGNAPVVETEVHLCPTCGYAGDIGMFDEDEDTRTVAFRWRVEVELTWNLPWAKYDAVERFHHALKVARWLEEPEWDLGNLALKGSWVAQAREDTEATVYFQHAAIRHFTLAQKQWDGVATKDRAWVSYIVGELWRRVGDAAMAREWFTAAETVAIENGLTSDRWVTRWAYLQRTDPKEYLT